jgi:hypothetical protein
MLLATQRITWQFDWGDGSQAMEDARSVNVEQLVVFPALVRTSDPDGSSLSCSITEIDADVQQI